MNAQELFYRDSGEAGLWSCGKCGLIHRSGSSADQCCRNYMCLTCGKDTGGRSWTVCDSCRSAKRSQEERDRFEKAEKVTDWDGWLYVEDCSYNNGFFESIDDLIDFYADDEEGYRPEYAWTCNGKRYVDVDYSDIEESIFDASGVEEFEDMRISGVDEFQAAIKAFNESNKDNLSYEPDYKKAVVIQWENHETQ